MTAHEIDVAYVLEGIPGVLGVYSLLGARPGEFVFAVHVERSTDTIAANQALLRVLPRRALAEVGWFLDVPPVLVARTLKLALEANDRQAARARVPPRPILIEDDERALLAPLPPLMKERRRLDASETTILVIDDELDAYRAVSRVFGVRTGHMLEADPERAWGLASTRPWDLVLCSAKLAFGRRGVVFRLAQQSRSAAASVVLVLREGEHELLLANVAELGLWNSYLLRPVDPTALELTRRGDWVVWQWQAHLPAYLPPVAPSAEGPQPTTRRKVPVIDDDLESHALVGKDPTIEVVLTAEPWVALDAIEAGDVDHVLCNGSLRTEGGVPIYRLLWNARPEIKPRFAFIVHELPGSASQRVLARPVRIADVARMLEGRRDG